MAAEDCHYQIVRCFRDEDLCATASPFTQLDLRCRSSAKRTMAVTDRDARSAGGRQEIPHVPR
jgi:aspartyl-tRNA synthetase